MSTKQSIIICMVLLALTFVTISILKKEGKGVPASSDTPVDSVSVFNSSKGAGNARDTVEEVMPVLDAVTRETNVAAKESVREERIRQALGVHSWQLERLDTITSQSIPDLIVNLANADDLSLASMVVGGGTPLSFQEPEVVSVVTPRLMRVRRLLWEARHDPDEVIPELRGAYETVLENWPMEFLKFFKQLHSGNLERIESELHGMYTHQALAAQYILAELGDIESLPLFWKDYTTNEPGLEEWEPDRMMLRGPSPISNTLTAIQRLASVCSEDELSPEARYAREQFLEAADAEIGPVTFKELPNWSSEAWLDDPRYKLNGVEPDIGSEVVEVAFHPYQFKEGEEIADDDGHVSPRAVPLLELAEEFIRLACPDAEPGVRTRIQ